MNIISNRPTHPNVIFISTKIDPQNSTERGGWEEAADGPWELGLGEAKGCVAYIPPGAPFPPLVLTHLGRGTGRQSSRTPSRLQTPPNDASGVTTRSWHYTDMGLSPGAPGVPQPSNQLGLSSSQQETRSPDSDCSILCSADGPRAGPRSGSDAGPRSGSSPILSCQRVAEPPQ